MEKSTLGLMFAAFLFGVLCTARWNLGPRILAPPGRRGRARFRKPSNGHRQRMQMLEKRLGSKAALDEAMRKQRETA